MNREETSTVESFEVVEAFSLRIPTVLRERIRESAVTNRRSLNAEMIVLMERALPGMKTDAAVTASASR